MPRLIKIDKTKEKKVTHKDCGAVIGYYPKEVESYVAHDYGGGSDTYYYITCPECGKKVFVSEP